MPERGKYFVFEGGDGTGKSTQAILFDKYIRSLGHDTLQVFNDETGLMEPIQEPGGTPAADILRRKIKDRTIERSPWNSVEWFTEARASIWNEAILPAFESGQHVITARSWLSTLAYQGYGEGMSLEEIRAYTREHVGEAYMAPDFVAILALKKEKARKTRLANRSITDSTADTFESKPEEFQTSMQSGYVQLAHDHGIELLDAEGSRTRVFRRILKSTQHLVDEM